MSGIVGVLLTNTTASRLTAPPEDNAVGALVALIDLGWSELFRPADLFAAREQLTKAPMNHHHDSHLWSVVLDRGPQDIGAESTRKWLFVCLFGMVIFLWMCQNYHKMIFLNCCLESYIKQSHQDDAEQVKGYAVTDVTVSHDIIKGLVGWTWQCSCSSISQFFVDTFVTFLPHAVLAAIFILQSAEISLCSHSEVHTDSAWDVTVRKCSSCQETIKNAISPSLTCSLLTVCVSPCHTYTVYSFTPSGQEKVRVLYFVGAPSAMIRTHSLQQRYA